MYEVEHTAEHIFMRSLQNLGKDVFVKKVEHGEINKIYVECNNLTLDDIYIAECITNDIIDAGREVREYIFNSLKDAKDRFPDLRAYEERISNKVRVVEIADHDHAACIKDHVRNTKECEFFIIKHISREKNLYEIEFLAGNKAKKQALEFGITCLRLIDHLQVSMNTLEDTIKNMKRDLESYKKSLAKLSRKVLESIKPDVIDGIKFYSIQFEDLDDRIIMKQVREVIKDNSILLISNKKEDRCTVILASDSIDCSSILSNALSRVGGKGGGKDAFASGSIPADREDECLRLLEENIKTQIYKTNNSVA
ncbi:MAG: hypothetical protein KatS3mg003_1591 [Candidatus Nitrosocaldaceae archaeon]|nr:MAG: hypothetical protein KatS3mg003_1591 [Candidatus Nitrosocaldaceae archaeon]